VKRVGDLEIDEALEFQRREWVVQRVGWGAMLVLVVLALLGLFGTGVLSSATAGDGNGPISAGYERFLRHGGEAQLTFTVAPDQVSDGQIELWIDADYLSSMDIQRVTPQPEEVQTRGDRLIYVFTVTESSAPHEFVFSMRPQEIGRTSAQAGIVDGAEISFRQLVYP